MHRHALPASACLLMPRGNQPSLQLSSCACFACLVAAHMPTQDTISPPPLSCLCRWHSGGPHFNRSLEWLLFTALEIDAEQRHSAAPAISSPHGGGRPARQRFNSSYAVAVGGGSDGGGGGGSTSGMHPDAIDVAASGSPPGSAAVRAGLVSPRSVGVLAAAALAQKRAGPLLVAAAQLISQFPQVRQCDVVWCLSESWQCCCMWLRRGVD